MMLSFNNFDRKSELNDYNSLFCNAFPEVEETTEKGYNWQFHNYPDAVKCSYEYGAYIDKQLVGYYAAIPYKYKIGEEETNVGMVCGVMTHSDHRGKGIFTKLGSYATNDLSSFVPFTTGYPIRKAVIPGHLKIGWKIAFELPLYIKVLKSNSFLRERKLYPFSLIINPFLSLYNTLTSLNSQKDYTIEICDSLNSVEGVEIFVAEWGNTVKNRLEKTKEFLNWRYARPNATYKFFIARKNNKLVSFAACREIERMGVPSLCIIDLMCVGDRKSLDVLFSSLVKYSKKANIEMIMTMMSKTSALQYRLLRNGFIKTPYNFKLIIKNLTNKFQDGILFDENRWHLMWVDSDDL